MARVDEEDGGRIHVKATALLDGILDSPTDYGVSHVRDLGPRLGVDDD